MGFFSWETQDSYKSIANKYSGRDTFTVYLIDDKGNRWREDSYDGYGEFGGKDYFELVAEMNGLDSDPYAGIDLYFSGRKDLKFPNLVEYPDDWSYTNSAPEDCDFQGYFYD
jgi:hypothetical protein